MTGSWARGVIAVVALHVAVIGAALAAGHVNDAPRRELAFYTHRDGQGQIVLMDVSRRFSVPLLRHDPYVVSLAWSPDGESLAFIAYDHIGGMYAYRLNLADRSVKKSSRKTAKNEGIRWSPDGRYIAFNGYAGPHPAVHLVDTATQSVTQISAPHILWNGEPGWSHDGAQLAFSGRGDSVDIYVMPMDCLLTACAPRLLVDHPAADRQPLWSPSSDRIAFVSDRSGQNAIYIMDTRCEDCRPSVRYVAELRLASTLMLWSPDGRRLIYTDTPRSVGSALYMAELRCDDCSPTIRRISAPDEIDTSPAWSDDGKLLAFVTRSTNRSAIALLDSTCMESPEGCAGRRELLTALDSNVWSPVWRPG